MNYINAINEVLKREGGFINHPLDKGGATNWGITQAVYEKFKGRKVSLDEMRSMPKSEAISIYKSEYWDKIQGDKISFYPVAYAIFDQAVNRGVGSAVRQAQKVVGIAQDGVMGPVTLQAINSKTDSNFLNNFIPLSEQFYKDLVLKNPSQSVFLKGWLNRVNEIKNYTNSFIGVVADNKGISASILAVVGIFFLIYISNSKQREKNV